MRVAAYYRVSSTQQQRRDTIAGQKSEVRALVASHADWTPVAEHEDDGRSARKGLAKRVGLAATLQLVREGKVDAVLFVAFDRLSRSESLKERGAILGDFQDAGCKIIVNGGRLIDLGTFSGRVEANLLLELAAEESAEKSRRCVRGRARAAAAGRPPCSPPWGYRYDHERRAWGACEAATLVRIIFERVAAGETCVDVAEDHHRRGIATARKGRWCAGTVSRIIRCLAYDSGRWVANKGTVVAVPVIVPPELAAMARARLDAHALRGLRKTKAVYLVDSLARCELCDSPILIHGFQKLSRHRTKLYKYTYYTCTRRRHSGRRGVCALPRQHVEAIDGRVWAAVERFARDPDPILDALAGHGEAATEDSARAREDAAEWRRKLGQLPAEEGRALELGRRGLLSVAALDVELTRIQRLRQGLERQVDAAERMIAAAAGDRATAEDLRLALADLADGAADSSQEERRALVRAICSAVTLGPSVVTVEIAVWLGVEKGIPIVSRGQTGIPFRATLLA